MNDGRQLNIGLPRPGKRLALTPVRAWLAADCLIQTLSIVALAAAHCHQMTLAADPVASSAAAGRPHVRTEARTTPPRMSTKREVHNLKTGESATPSPRGIGVQSVQVEGIGETEELALRQAFRNAVREVLGMIVSTKSATRDDILVMNRVVLFSYGFVDSYKVLETTFESGVVRKTIVATVRKRDLARQIHTEQSTNSHDARGLWPEAVTKNDRRKEASVLLKSTLEDYPWNCLRVELAGKPSVGDTSNDTARLTTTLVLKVDPNRFRDVETTLNAALGGLATISGSVSTLPTRAKGSTKDEFELAFRGRFLRASSPSPISVSSVDFSGINLFGNERGWPPKKLVSADEKGRILFVVGNGRAWSWYLVPEMIDLPKSPKVAWIRFCDEAGAVVAKRSVGLGPCTPGISINQTSDSGKALTTVFISPFFLDHSANGYMIDHVAGCTSITVVGKVDIPLKELSKVDDVGTSLE